MYFNYYYYDWTYLLVVLAGIITLIAQARVKGTFQKYSRIRSRSGLTGVDTARKMLQYAGIFDVKIERVSGQLSDHYDSTKKVLRLSESTYDSDSVAAIGVAAHECGHAIQHFENYTPLNIRRILVPAANIGSYLGVPIIILGFLLDWNQTLIQIGIVVFSMAVLFQLVTLPVEFNASRRAVKLVEQYGILAQDEVPACKKVLSAAALTYVAAAAASVLQLIRFVVLSGGNRRRD
jgi:uncharacterized protein